jgi:hypothetical protein
MKSEEGRVEMPERGREREGLSVYINMNSGKCG